MLDQASPFAQQSHQLFAVTDFRAGKIDVDLGIGYGSPGLRPLGRKDDSELRISGAAEEG